MNLGQSYKLSGCPGNVPGRCQLKNGLWKCLGLKIANRERRPTTANIQHSWPPSHVLGEKYPPAIFFRVSPNFFNTPKL